MYGQPILFWDALVEQSLHALIEVGSLQLIQRHRNKEEEKGKDSWNWHLTDVILTFYI